MHHHIRVTEENVGTKNLEGDWVDATYSIDINIDYEAGSEMALLVALQKATNAFVNQITATHKTGTK